MASKNFKPLFLKDICVSLFLSGKFLLRLIVFSKSTVYLIYLGSAQRWPQRASPGRAQARNRAQETRKKKVK